MLEYLNKNYNIDKEMKSSEELSFKLSFNCPSRFSACSRKTSCLKAGLNVDHGQCTNDVHQFWGSYLFER